jgi:hypothetical protein
MSPAEAMRWMAALIPDSYGLNNTDARSQGFLNSAGKESA